MIQFNIKGLRFYVDCDSFTVTYRKHLNSIKKDNMTAKYHDWYNVMDEGGCHLKLMNRCLDGKIVEDLGNDIYRGDSVMESIKDDLIILVARKEGNEVFKYGRGF